MRVVRRQRLSVRSPSRLEAKYWRVMVYFGSMNVARPLVATKDDMLEGMSDTFDRAYESINTKAEEITAMVVYPLTYGG